MNQDSHILWLAHILIPSYFHISRFLCFPIVLLRCISILCQCVFAHLQSNNIKWAEAVGDNNQRFWGSMVAVMHSEKNTHIKVSGCQLKQKGIGLWPNQTEYYPDPCGSVKTLRNFEHWAPRPLLFKRLHFSGIGLAFRQPGDSAWAFRVGSYYSANS